MLVQDFDYTLPEELIAQTPLKDRDKSRLLVYDRKTKEIQHRIFSDIVEYIRPEDCLVLNNTRVLPARLLGKKSGTGGSVEMVLLKDLGDNQWEVLVNPGRRVKEGCIVEFGDGLLKARVIKRTEEGNRLVQFEYQGIWQEILDTVGIMPLPPYIHATLEDKERYQTVYSKINGSAAAPTAGLHFTKELLETIAQKGTEIAYLTLHVGLGTFRPVKEETVQDHKMHTEYYAVDEETAEKINAKRRAGGRIIAVGTTSCRVLETVTTSDGVVHAGEGDTGIFIYPGYTFKAVDALITNFHLPKSTLLMLISAFAGREEVLRFYGEAIAEKYRFFSFGDACLML